MADTYNFDPAASHWLVRAYHTPMGDALRGRLSARLDVRHTIAAAGLPQPVAQLIYTVCRGTRLWRREKHDVARELVAHFADGLAAGRTADELAKTFGPPEQAARLIRRAKLRNRPLWWQSWRVVSRLFLLAVAVVLLAYGALSARFYLGRPNIAHNYWQEINAARRFAEQDRAWPIYREALLMLGHDDIDSEWLDEGPTGKNFGKAVEMLERDRDALKLVRQGAQKPHLGYFLGDPADRQAAVAAHQEWKFSEQSADENQSLISALLDGIQEQRRLPRLLHADARLAAINSDGALALADLTALIAMSEQLFQPDAFLVDQLVGIAMFGVAIDAAGTILTDSPQVFSEAQLRELAHRIAAYRGGSVAVDFETERMMFDDLLQRAFTDDGQGNGRITAEGIRLLNDLLGEQRSVMRLLNPDRDEQSAAFVATVLGPGLAALVGSREDNRDFYRSMMDEMIAVHQGPPWRWDRKTLDDFDRRMCEMTAAGPQHLRYWLPANMLPALSAIFNSVERSAQVRDAADVTIALVLWQRRHGTWPTSLNELVPDLLPAVPPDRADGKPLRYVVRDGKPVIYSIGSDRDDDGGRPSADPDAAMVISFGPTSPTVQQQVQADNDGDWILWPTIKQNPSGEAADAEPSS
jgi:hypothetical protein